MTAAQDLMADPVGFMQDNIVIVEMEGNNVVRSTAGTQSLSLFSRSAVKVKGHKRNFRKTRVGVYYLSYDPLPGFFTGPGYGAIVDPHTITAYFCPYKGTETHGTVISNGADLMFTTQMDGCSLGIGSATGGGDRLVFHANSGGTSNVAVNNQDQSLRREFATDNTQIQKIWAPNDYRLSSKGTAYKATTFGVRNPANNAWSFYSQRYTVEAVAPATIYGLKEVLTVL